jgi:5-methyltetrahydropteroyltriglutamate--homocysteine methyltransferase
LYTGQTAVQTDIDNLQTAYAGIEAEEAFITAVAPGSIITRRINQFYPSEEAFLFAIADAMKTEYKAIVDAGILLQIDDPQLVTRYDMEDPPPDAGQYRKHATARVEALNHALADIPQDRVRYHICWGGWHGPHTTDLPLKDIVSLLLQVRAGAYLIEAANARHEHEWRVWEQVKLPEGKILIPGVVSHATNVVEHPELVAERIVRFANLVGRENVIAGTNCGLGGRLHRQLVWANLKALSEGARLATSRLWGRA